MDDIFSSFFGGGFSGRGSRSQRRGNDLRHDVTLSLEDAVFGKKMEIKLDTNGTNPDMLYEILCEGIAEYVAMDIKASPDNYGKAAGIDISREMMAKITSSKDMLIKGGPAVHEFRTTVVGGLHGDEDFEGIRDYIKGAANYFLQRYTENDNVLCKDRGFYSPSKEELERYLEIVKPAVGHAAIRGVD